MKIRVSRYFHLPTPHPALATHPPRTPCTSPHTTAAAPSWLRHITDSQLPQPPKLCCDPTSLPADTTPETEKQHDCNCVRREGGVLLSHASWNLCSASQETFSACVKDGSSWEAYGTRFAEKVVVQPESSTQGSSQINKQPRSLQGGIGKVKVHRNQI